MKPRSVVLVHCIPEIVDVRGNLLFRFPAWKVYNSSTELIRVACDATGVRQVFEFDLCFIEDDEKLVRPRIGNERGDQTLNLTKSILQ
ncbi:hypothetical protein BGZ88_008068 [Linnemannia elongata]|nr:hypothetical protein BGZ88_008068 [Linnemannia elongata]